MTIKYSDDREGGTEGGREGERDDCYPYYYTKRMLMSPHKYVLF